MTDSVQIFLRLRPCIEQQQQQPQQKQSKNVLKNQMKINDDNTIVSIINSDQIEQYEFDQIFNTETDQSTIFTRICRPMLKSLIDEQKDALLFAYGITSSGKSYTINGTPNAPGLIPRTLAYLFQQIPTQQLFNHENYQSMTLSYERRYFQTLKQWSNICIEIDGNDDDHEDNGEDAKIMKDSLKNGQKKYCLFISFVEIYNNYIYDLLEIPNPKQMKWIRTRHTLVNDSNQMVYVQGVQEIQVKNLDQAFGVYLFGLQNRQLSQTMMNEQSSRSHSIFTLKLIHLDDDHLAKGGGYPNLQLKVSQFSIVDLAGLERLNRTGNCGRKLFEAGWINNSLMTLRTCFDAIQKINNNQNNQNTDRILIPYRQSRLTYLLKRFFEFRSTIRMILCASFERENFGENLHVLNFGRKIQRIRLDLVQIRQRNLSGDSIPDDGQDELNYGDLEEDQNKESPTMKNIENFRQNFQQFESKLNDLSDRMESILQKLDQSLKHLPPTRLDRQPIFLPLQLLSSTMAENNRLNFQQILLRLQQQQKSLNNNNQSSKSLIELREFRHELHRWQQDNRELETKFIALLADCQQRYRVDLSSSSSVSHHQPPSTMNGKFNETTMNVYDRLYYQSPARYKQNQLINRSIIESNNRFQINLKTKTKTTAATTTIKKLPPFRSNQSGGGGNIVNQYVHRFVTNTGTGVVGGGGGSVYRSAAAIRRPNPTASIGPTPIKRSTGGSTKIIPRMRTIMSTTTTTTDKNFNGKTITIVNNKRQMSDKIRKLCRKFEPIEKLEKSIVKRKLF
ncbi:Kinesin-like protein kif23 [Dermatophagoides pteronyssinus]|uniref:Kinesin-like protein kif23 n=1 Tax=Dermatophagoides pteronyssinus TaxID=6956 RepID=A0ABQ8J8X7_DERPT|nr:Kinesin-like protein kif23 [Dermatophagoides pteronyssinus]